MLSICIPVYNFDVNSLVKELHHQALSSGYPFEILLMDDASDEEYRRKNQSIDLKYVRYIQLSGNIGRSKIRNRLAETAIFNHLLFMDCDSKIASPSYIEKYTCFFYSWRVCCGGRMYENKRPDDSSLLRWKYGRGRECSSASKRSKTPNTGFQSNNFLIHKGLFTKIKFNEELTGYGHEDTLFGLELQGQGIVVHHIDNPLIHSGLEDASEFLKKTALGIENLNKIEKILREKYPTCVNHSKLMRTKLFLQKYHLSGIVSGLLTLFQGRMKKNLSGTNPSLFLFDLYRLLLIYQHHTEQNDK